MPVTTDLSQLDVMSPAEEGRWFVLLAPATGEPIALTSDLDPQGKPISVARIKIKGANSDTAQRFFRDRTNINLAQAAKKSRRDPITAEDLLGEMADLLARITITWELPPLDGQAFPYSLENARRLYSDPRFKWIREAVDREFNDELPFLTQSQPS